MKKMIISAKQLNALQEASQSSNSLDISVNAADNSASGFQKALSDPNTQSDLQKASVAGDVNAVVRGPKTTDSSVTVDLDVPKGGTVSQSLMGNTAINTALQNGAALRVHGDGYGNLGETTVSKKSLEEMRINNMRKNGTIMTKKQIMESVEEEMSLKEKLNEMNAFVVMDAYKKVFGDDAVQALATEFDMVGAIIKTVMSAPQDQRNLFMSYLNGDAPEEEPIDLEIEF